VLTTIMPFFRNSFGSSPSQKDDRKKLLISYGPDWLLTITLAGAFFFLDGIDGFRREFSVSDTSLRHPYAVHERVPPVALYCISMLAPLVLQWLINLLTIRTLWDAHNSALGLVLSLCLTGAFTQAIKITVGRPRPDILDRCKPDAGTVDPEFGLSTSAICHQPDLHILKDGFRSFPSGHSSLSFAGLTFLSLYIAGKMHLFDTRGHTHKAWISFLPLLGAALVAISRTMDYRHHWQDVLAGSLLGFTIANFAYRQYFPSLSSKRSHLPYAPRTLHPQDTRRPAPVLPYYHRRSMDSQGEAEVELLSGAVSHGNVGRNEPEQQEQSWERGSSVEDGNFRS